MEKKKLCYDDFLTTVSDSDKEFVSELHESFLAHGCTIEVKEAKSGYVVSYLHNKKAVANYVFRKTGMLLRLYAKHVQQYMNLLDTLPDAMVKTIQAAPVCKRLINPDDCNPKCAMGYDFLLRGERQQKCRNNAFLLPVCAENNAALKSLVEHELAACRAEPI